MIQRRLWAVLVALCIGKAPAHAQEAPLSPVKGMVLVYSGHGSKAGQDWENLITVTDLTDTEVVFGIEWFKDGQLTDRKSRRVRLEDMATARRTNDTFQPGDGALFPGATLANVSTAILAELKSKGSAAVVIGTDPQAGRGDFGFSGRKYYRGEITVVGREDITVLVNGVPRALPTLHTKGMVAVGGETITVEDWWFDNPPFPLDLRTTSPDGSGRQSQIVRIDTPQPRAENTLQATLASPACRAELHGIYFNTGSAFLLPQSATTLRTVAALLDANKGWTLTVEGHTDNVGGAAYNLDLSQRRATAVRDALVNAHGASAAQLRVQGLGLTRPVDDNSTLEGRARNRRVELARACPP